MISLNTLKYLRMNKTRLGPCISSPLMYVLCEARSLVLFSETRETLLRLPREERSSHWGLGVRERQMWRFPPYFDASAVMSAVLKALVLPVPPGRQDPSKIAFLKEPVLV